MATQSFPPVSNGGPHKQAHPGNVPKTGGKQPLNNKLKNKLQSARQTDSASAGAAEGDDDETDSSAIEELTGPEGDDADVFALSNGRQQFSAERRSAGSKSSNEDVIMDDDVAGAEQDSDDDDQYADVEDISDSEVSDAGDVKESRVRRAAEGDLIGEFEREEQRKEQRKDTDSMSNAINDMAIDDDEARDIAIAQQLSLQDIQDAESQINFNFEVNMNDDPFIGLNGDDSMYKAMWDEAEVAMWRRPGQYAGSPSQRPTAANGTQKRVRFEEVHDTASRASTPDSSDDEENNNNAFPDLFASQDDPIIQRHLALDLDEDNVLGPYDWNDNESCYDFDGEEESLAFQVDEEEDSDESDDDSDATDSDGDDTEEESEEEQKAKFHERRAAAAKLRGTPVTPPPNRTVSRPTSSASTPRPSTPGTTRGPQMGTFAKDPSRATITNDAVAKRCRIEPPSNPPEKDRAFWENARKANLTASGSRRGSGVPASSPGSESMPTRPFTARSTLGTMFDGNLDLLRNNPAGDREPVFVPPPLSNAQLSYSATEESDDDLVDINMQDFVEMPDSDDEGERPTSAHADSEPEFSSSQTPGQATASPGMLDHFELNRGLVGSFRRNQQSTKHFSSLPSHPAKRASTHEYNALQKGRRGAANTPMTPARKKRASQDLTQVSGGVRKAVSSPLTSRRPRSRGNSITTKNPAGLYDTLARTPF